MAASVIVGNASAPAISIDYRGASKLNSPGFHLRLAPLSLGSRKALRISRALASDGDDEWGESVARRKEEKKDRREEKKDRREEKKDRKEEKKDDEKSSVATAPAEPSGSDDTQGLKRALLDSLYGTDRGLKASSETRAEVNELITQLEAKNPTEAPTEALALLNGKWILVYTSFSELFPLLAAGTIPLVKVGEISQTIDSRAFTVQNSVSFTGPLTTTSFSASASFEVRSPKRVQIKFEQGIIGTPQLTDSIDLPESVDFLGQKIDLTQARDVLKPLQDAATSVVEKLSGQPPLKFALLGGKQSWLLTTYLDDDLRISRGDGGGVFLLVKEGSPLQSYN